jgi:glycerate kinase
MKIVIAPDSFKESLTADAAALAIEAGFRQVWPQAEMVRLPMADGGEGTVAAIAAAAGGTVVPVVVTGPMGARVAAFYWLSGDGLTAVVEMAAASGLELVAADERDPMRATSYGTGELIRAALEAGVEHCVVGIGGSATVDGGAGMLQALGAVLLDAEGRSVAARGGASLAALERIDLSGLDRRIALCRMEVGCDVDNPLIGPHGAAAVFGPQKGATPAMVVALEAGLGRFARAVHAATGVDVSAMPGAGAAGGMGAALVACLGATMRPGVELVAEVAGLEDAVRDADLVVTGEGRIDEQSVRGKTPVGVAAVARRHGVPVIVLAGSLGHGVEKVYDYGIDAVFSVLQSVCSREEAYAGAAVNLQAAARNVGLVWKAARAAR